MLLSPQRGLKDRGEKAEEKGSIREEIERGERKAEGG